MGFRSDKAKGRTKQAAGVLADDRDLEREGKVDKAAGEVKEKAHDAKEAVEDAADAVRDKARRALRH